MAKKKRRKTGLVPRLGPPENLRPAGAHESLKRYNRRRMKAALRREAESGFSVSNGSVGRLTAVAAAHHPLLTEAIFQHPEVATPKGWPKGHHHRTAVGKSLEDALGLFGVLRRE